MAEDSFTREEENYEDEELDETVSIKSRRYSYRLLTVAYIELQISQRCGAICHRHQQFNAHVSSIA